MNIPTNIVSVEPTTEPVTVPEVKRNIPIWSDTSYDSEIKDWIPIARRMVEEIAKRSLITQTRIQYYDDLYDCMHLRYGPVQSVTSVTYKDSAEATQTLTASLYVVDTARVQARIVKGYDDTYPDSIRDTNSVAVTMVCGYGAAAAVPGIYKRAIIQLCTLWHYNRSTIACGTADAATMEALERLIAIEGATYEYA